MSSASTGWKHNLTIERQRLPKIDIRQLLRLSDDTGILQHATHAAPNPNHGYCIDDNARALIAGIQFANLRPHEAHRVPLHRYLSFLIYAFNEANSTFRNFMSYDRQWLETSGSEDSQGRTLWALGLTVRFGPAKDIRNLAHTLFQRALPSIEHLNPIRSKAFALIGLNAFVDAVPNHEPSVALRDRLTQELFDTYQHHATPDWPWWEDTVTYANAKLPHALLLGGTAIGRTDVIEGALESLKWLLEIQTTPKGHLSPIGNKGWMTRNGTKAQFDQQPIEAHALVEACLLANRWTNENIWVDHAWRSFEWFTGCNDLNIPLHDQETGGCHDGLQCDGVNQNQGSESSLAYLLCVLQLHLYHQHNRSITKHKNMSTRQKIRRTVVGFLRGNPKA